MRPSCIAGHGDFSLYLHEFVPVILYPSTSETIHLEAAFVVVSCRVHSSHAFMGVLGIFVHQHKVAIVLSFNPGSATWDILNKLYARSRSPYAVSVSRHPFPTSWIVTFLPSPPPPTLPPFYPTFFFHLPTFFHIHLSLLFPHSPPYLSACLSPS